MLLELGILIHCCALSQVSMLIKTTFQFNLAEAKKLSGSSKGRISIYCRRSSGSFKSFILVNWNVPWLKLKLRVVGALRQVVLLANKVTRPVEHLTMSLICSGRLECLIALCLQQCDLWVHTLLKFKMILLSDFIIVFFWTTTFYDMHQHVFIFVPIAFLFNKFSGVEPDEGLFEHDHTLGSKHCLLVSTPDCLSNLTLTLSCNRSHVLITCYDRSFI